LSYNNVGEASQRSNLYTKNEELGVRCFV